MKMKSLGRFMGSCLLLFSFVACATDAFPNEFEQKPVKRVLPVEDAYYGPPEPAIKKLLLFEKKNRSTNHFCVVGYAWPDNNVTVWVHWTEAQRLLLWRENSAQEMREKGLVHAQRNLKLGKDTVEKSADIQGSSYLVTRAWWQAVTKDCAAHGQKFTIKPFAQKAR
jgi:hypothetical protein